MADAFIPLEEAILKALARGTPPPVGYNDGTLFLLPKKGSHVAADTRPISVTNTDNRLLAATVTGAVMELVSSRLDPAQQGFLKGRNYDSHIIDLNHDFYSAVESEDGRNYFALFMDTAKAFDSVDHDFVLLALERLGLPPWFCNVVQGLLHLPKVRLWFNGLTATTIDIRRGVKQGCPLSPLLFIVCYDVLLSQLRTTPGVRCYGVADDLAMAASRFEHFYAPMNLVNKFQTFSGLGLNLEKTVVISAQDTSLASLIALSPWMAMKQVDSAVYLGIPFGRKLTLECIFRPTFRKIDQRFSSFDGALRKMSLAKRIHTANVFVMSMLSYVLRFYPLPGPDEDMPLPPQLYSQLRALFSKHIITYRGSGYKYFHLLQPSSRFGPVPALKDFWSYSIASGAARFDLTQLDGLTKVPSYVSPNSLLITNLDRACAHDFMAEDLSVQEDELLTARRAGGVNAVATFKASSWLDPDPNKRRRALYQRTLLGEYRDYQDNNLKIILDRRGIPGTLDNVRHLHNGFAALGSSMPNLYRNIQFKLTLNALPTSRRGRWKDGPQSAQQACFLCGCGHGTDHYDHIFFGDCQAVSRARSCFSHAIKVDLSPSACGAESLKAAALLIFPHKQANAPATRAICLFNAVVWQERTYHYKDFRGDVKHNEASVVNRLSATATFQWHQLNKPKISKGLGNASTRTDTQAAAARSYASDIIATMDTSGLMIYTDGSTQGNTGPCGAGGYIRFPPPPGNDSRNTFEKEFAIGVCKRGTNNLGELWAIAAALQLGNSAVTEHLYLRGREAYIITDSQYAIGCLTKGWISKTEINKAVCAAIKRMLSSSTLNWHINWVPGHAGVDGNEVADAAANRGAELSRRGKHLLNLPSKIENLQFTS